MLQGVPLVRPSMRAQSWDRQNPLLISSLDERGIGPSIAS